MEMTDEFRRELEMIEDDEIREVISVRFRNDLNAVRVTIEVEKVMFANQIRLVRSFKDLLESWVQDKKSGEIGLDYEENDSDLDFLEDVSDSDDSDSDDSG